MQTYIATPSFEQVDSFTANLLCTIAPELTVFGVFLVSYGLFRFVSAQDQDAGRKPKVAEACLRQAPKRTEQRVSTPSVSTRACQELEAQMLRHLEQLEFTRALNLYRGARSESNGYEFSEAFYIAFIESAVRVGKMDVAERLFAALKQSSLIPSEEFWRRMFRIMASRKHFSLCLAVHAAFKDRLPADKVVWSCLANAALEVGEAHRAATMLEQFAKSDICVKDHILFFRVYLALKDVDSAEAIFRKLGSQTSSLMLNHLLLTCVNSGQAERALQLLHDAHELESAGAIVDIVSYNTVIKGLAQAGKVSACFQCMRELFSRGLQPDDITFTTLLDACLEADAIDMIGEIVNLASEGTSQVGTVMYTLFIKGLVRANCLPKALELCEEMKQKAGARPDVVTYSVLIKGLVDQHDLERALSLVADMKSAGHAPDDIILTHLLEGCRYAGDYELGKKLFLEMLTAGVKPSEFTLVTMLKLCGRAGEHQEAHDLVAGWEAAWGQKPSVIHYTCLMSGCICRKQYDFAWAAYELMRTHGVKPDVCTFSTLLPGMVAARNWDHVLAIAKEYALVGPSQHKIRPEVWSSALSQMQGSPQAGELIAILRSAGVSIAAQRSRPPRPQAGRA